MHGQNVKFTIAFAQPRTQARERKCTFEEHLKRKIQDPRKIEHIFQVCKFQYYKERLRENFGNSIAVWKTINDVMGRNIKQSKIDSIRINSIIVAPRPIPWKCLKHLINISLKVAKV